MKNFANFIEVSEKSMKSVSTSLRGANKVYTSISQVLKDIQRTNLMRAGYSEVFAALGLPTDGKFTPAQFFAAMNEEQKKTIIVREKGKDGKTIKVEKQALGIWGYQQKVNDNGEKVYEEDGKTPVLEPVLRTVTAWTPNKFFKCIAQANALNVAE